jgi:hypothetical protein
MVSDSGLGGGSLKKAVMKVDLDALQPEERRILLVASPQKYDELVARLDAKKLVALAALPVLGPLLGIFGSALRMSAYLAGTWTAVGRLARRQGEDDRSFLQRLVTKGPVLIPHIDPSEARKRFRFEMGGPEDGAAYVLSPTAPDYYMLPAVANERLAQEKLAAFVQIAAALGARRIAIASAEVRAQTGRADARIPLAQAAAQLGIVARFDARGAVERQVLMEFDPPRVAPHLPSGFDAWLEAEPLLRTLVKTRLSGQPRSARVSLEFGDVLDVGVAATAELAGRGIRVGGPYRSVARSSWSFEIEYWPWDGEPLEHTGDV